MDPSEFRVHGYALVDCIADYLSGSERYPVLPATKPGDVRDALPRSAPDALRGVPGVSVQQTSHGQASPYVRGLTGQRVVHLFDGIRLNTGIYRQGPNQYFFTVVSATLERLEVVRGSASTNSISRGYL